MGASQTRRRGRFPTTSWSLIASAGRASAPDAREALARLCEAYWYPLYAFVRRRGHGAEEALDLTQGFFARIIEKQDLADADRARGRFRSWLLGALKHFLANAHDRATAQKRGGGAPLVSIDGADAEERWRLEPSHDATPERIFERRWALALLERTLVALRDECARKGKGPLFEALKGSLVADGGPAGPAAELDLTPNALKVAAHRLRRRYRDLLRAQIAETVATPEDVDGEIRDLFAALG
jgi:RNA polymerase sigma-70 factor (ECF subfamily)